MGHFFFEHGKGNVKNSEDIIKKLKNLKYAYLLGGLFLASITVKDVNLPDPNLYWYYALTTYFTGIYTGISTILDEDIKELQKTKKDLLQEKIADFENKNISVRQKVKEIKKSMNLNLATSIACTATTTALSLTLNPNTLSIIPLTAIALIGGLSLAETIKEYKNLQELPKKEQDYSLSTEELEMFNKKITNNNQRTR